MTTWHWVRHGPTHQKCFTGWRNVPADLTDARAVARLEACLPQDALIVSSDLARCISTADALSAGRQRLPHDPGLRELHFGAWDGIHFTKVSAQDDALCRKYWEQPGDTAPPGGESWNAAATRVAAAMRRVEAAYQPEAIIAVAHFGVILTQVQATMGVTASQAIAHRIDPLSVTTLRPADGIVERINHLP